MRSTLALLALTFIAYGPARAQLNDVPMSIHVQDAFGKPIPDAQVEVRYHILGVNDTKQTGRTDAEGNFNYMCSAQADEYKISVQASAFAPWMLDWKDARDGKKNGPPPLSTAEIPYKVTLAAHPVDLRGLVTDPNGAFIPKVDVIITREGQQIAHIKTDKHGYFQFHAIPGSYTLQFTVPNHQFKDYLQKDVSFENGKILSFRMRIGDVF
jgi:hypothetical protein